MENLYRKYASKASLRPPFNFDKLSKIAVACNKFFLGIRCFERGLSKTLLKENVNFSFRPVPFNGQDHEKQKVSGASDQLLFRLQNKLRKIPLLVTSCTSGYKTSSEKFIY